MCVGTDCDCHLEEPPDDLCGYCMGRGGIHDGDSWSSCPKCHGTGRVEDQPEEEEDDDGSGD